MGLRWYFQGVEGEKVGLDQIAMGFQGGPKVMGNVTAHGKGVWR